MMMLGWARGRVCAVFLTLTLLTAAGCAAAADPGDPAKLVLGVIPYENSASVAQDWQPFAAMLREETGKEVTVQVVTDYAALIEGQRAGSIHLAVYGPLSYVLAHDSGAGVEPVGVEIAKKGGSPDYRSYLVTKDGSGIDELADLRGKRICFVDPNSASGYLYPVAGLLVAGLTQDGYTPQYAGGHDASALAVRDGDCDAGAVQDRVFDSVLPREGRVKPGELRKIWTSGPIVNSPLAMSSRLNPALRGTLVRAVTQRGNADALGLPDLAGIWGFKPVDDAFYDSVREVCAAAKVKLCGG